jgi:deoxyribodipyrimidine photo-lyase
MTEAPAIVWFRDDLRLADQPALAAAAKTGRPLLCAYVFDEESAGLRPFGGASRWMLHGALARLDEALAEQGGALHLFRGPARAVIERLAQETGAAAVSWTRRYDAAGIAVDAEIKAALKARGVAAESFNGQLLYEPWTIETKSGGPFRVFSAFWRAATGDHEPPAPTPAPGELRFATPPKAIKAETVKLDDLALEPKRPDWAGGLRAAWTRGEAGAEAQLDAFLDEGLKGYASLRDRPDLSATSRLSPHLRLGTISPRQIWHAAAAVSGVSDVSASDLERFHTELGWREFSYHLLYHQPDLATANMRPAFDAMPWRTDEAALEAWRRGRTGYPLVDAGMRELWTTGYMHNRVRMVAASFLIKHLMIDWRRGESWFWDALVDADPANNPASWQWVAGAGADATPYFRIFNPMLQGVKFDPNGDYIRRWVPELATLPARFIHDPSAAPAAELKAAGVRLGTDYPEPIVEHGFARERALAAFKALGGG